MIATAKASPETFFAVCSKLIPKDVELTVRQHLGALRAHNALLTVMRQSSHKSLLKPPGSSSK
jgi:hypothetical protein